jgi:hypothetical protein
MNKQYTKFIVEKTDFNGNTVYQVGIEYESKWNWINKPKTLYVIEIIVQTRHLYWEEYNFGGTEFKSRELAIKALDDLIKISEELEMKQTKTIKKEIIP